MTQNPHTSVTAALAVNSQEESAMAKKAKERSAAEKSADFKKLASKHANTAIGAVRRLGKLARPSRYHWTPSQIETLEAKFSEELGALFVILKNPPKKGGKVTENIFE